MVMESLYTNRLTCATALNVVFFANENKDHRFDRIIIHPPNARSLWK